MQEDIFAQEDIDIPDVNTNRNATEEMDEDSESEEQEILLKPSFYQQRG